MNLEKGIMTLEKYNDLRRRDNDLKKYNDLRRDNGI